LSQAVRDRSFALGLAVLSGVGFGIALAYALAVSPDEIVAGDATQYHLLAQGIADGQGYSTLSSLLRGEPEPTAQHPPLFPLVLAGLDLIGLDTLEAHRVVLCFVAAASVALVGLLGRRVAGPRAGLIAAGLAALYPGFFMLAGVAMTESLYIPLIALTLLVTYTLLDVAGAPRGAGGVSPRMASLAALVGALIGLTILDRTEAVLLLPLLALAVALRVRGGRERVRVVAVMTVATLLVLAPWLVRNWAAMDRFPVLSTNGGLTAMVANCEGPYYLDVGFIQPDCLIRCERLRENELRYSDCGERVAREYAEDHLGRVPVVVVARVARTWNLYGVGKDVSYAEFGGRNRTASKVKVGMYFLLLPLAALGAWVLVRRRRPLLPLLAPVLMATIATALTYGFSHYRIGADVALVVLGATGLDRLVARLGWPRGKRPG
jgi:4-amino-4-deoxy-L-arabinose transferase-like glycosyltransferase